MFIDYTHAHANPRIDNELIIRSLNLTKHTPNLQLTIVFSLFVMDEQL